MSCKRNEQRKFVVFLVESSTMQAFKCVGVLMNLCFFDFLMYYIFLFRSSYIFDSFTKPSVIWGCSLNESILIIDISISIGLCEMTTSHALTKTILNKLFRCHISYSLIAIFTQFDFGQFTWLSNLGLTPTITVTNKHMSLHRFY